MAASGTFARIDGIAIFDNEMRLLR